MSKKEKITGDQKYSPELKLRLDAYNLIRATVEDLSYIDRIEIDEAIDQLMSRELVFEHTKWTVSESPLLFIMLISELMLIVSTGVLSDFGIASQEVIILLSSIQISLACYFLNYMRRAYTNIKLFLDEKDYLSARTKRLKNEGLYDLKVIELISILLCDLSVDNRVKDLLRTRLFTSEVNEQTIVAESGDSTALAGSPLEVISAFEQKS